MYLFDVNSKNEVVNNSVNNLLSVIILLDKKIDFFATDSQISRISSP
jgi:hypothetical protein